MVVFPYTMYTYRDTEGAWRFKIDNFFLIFYFCNSIQLIQILHAWIQRGGGKGSGPPGINTSYMGIGNKQLPPPPPPPPGKIDKPRPLWNLGKLQFLKNKPLDSPPPPPNPPPPHENSWIRSCRLIDTNLEILLEFHITIAGNFSFKG